MAERLCDVRSGNLSTSSQIESTTPDAAARQRRNSVYDARNDWIRDKKVASSCTDIPGERPRLIEESYGMHYRMSSAKTRARSSCSWRMRESSSQPVGCTSSITSTRDGTGHTVYSRAPPSYDVHVPMKAKSSLTRLYYTPRADYGVGGGEYVPMDGSGVRVTSILGPPTQAVSTPPSHVVFRSNKDAWHHRPQGRTEHRFERDGHAFSRASSGQRSGGRTGRDEDDAANSSDHSRHVEVASTSHTSHTTALSNATHSYSRQGSLKNTHSYNNYHLYAHHSHNNSGSCEPSVQQLASKSPLASHSSQPACPPTTRAPSQHHSRSESECDGAAVQGAANRSRSVCGGSGSGGLCDPSGNSSDGVCSARAVAEGAGETTTRHGSGGTSSNSRSRSSSSVLIMNAASSALPRQTGWQPPLPAGATEAALPQGGLGSARLGPLTSANGGGSSSSEYAPLRAMEGSAGAAVTSMATNEPSRDSLSHTEKSSLCGEKGDTEGGMPARMSDTWAGAAPPPPPALATAAHDETCSKNSSSSRVGKMMSLSSSSTAAAEKPTAAPLSHRKIYEVRGPTAPRSLAFQRSCTLGSGGCGHVFKAVLREGSLVAVKELKLESTNPDAFDREVSAMSSLPPHPNCVRYFGARHSRHHYYIIMEYISGGSIQSLRRSVGPLRESVLQRYAHMTLTGLHHLHTHGIIHRDIKGANVLLDERGCVKIVDFGCCKDVNQSGVTIGAGGTPLWMAPEVCRGEPATARSDVWSFGCLCLEMTNETGLPWTFPAGMNIPGVIYAIACATKSPPIPSNLSPLAQDLLDGCLKVNPAERLDVAELLQHPFFLRNYLDEMSDDDTDGLIMSKRAPRNGKDEMANMEEDSDFHKDHRARGHGESDTPGSRRRPLAGRTQETADRMVSIEGDLVHLNMPWERANTRDGKHSSSSSSSSSSGSDRSSSTSISRSPSEGIHNNNCSKDANEIADEGRGGRLHHRPTRGVASHMDVMFLTDCNNSNMNNNNDNRTKKGGSGSGTLSPAKQFLQQLSEVHASDTESNNGEAGSDGAESSDNETAAAQKKAADATRRKSTVMAIRPLQLRKHHHHTAEVARKSTPKMSPVTQANTAQPSVTPSSPLFVWPPSSQRSLGGGDTEKARENEKVVVKESPTLQLHKVQRGQRHADRGNNNNNNNNDDNSRCYDTKSVTPTTAHTTRRSASHSSPHDFAAKRGVQKQGKENPYAMLPMKFAQRRRYSSSSGGSSSHPPAHTHPPHRAAYTGQDDRTAAEQRSRRHSLLDKEHDSVSGTPMDFEETLEMDDNKLMADIIHFARCSNDSTQLHDHVRVTETTSSVSASVSDTVSEDEEEYEEVYDGRHDIGSSLSAPLRRAEGRTRHGSAVHSSSRPHAQIHKSVKPLTVSPANTAIATATAATTPSSSSLSTPAQGSAVMHVSPPFHCSSTVSDKEMSQHLQGALPAAHRTSSMHSKQQQSQQKEQPQPPTTPAQHVMYLHTDAATAPTRMTQQYASPSASQPIAVMPPYTTNSSFNYTTRKNDQIGNAVSSETILWESGGESCVVRAAVTPRAADITRPRSFTSTTTHRLGDELAHVAASRRMSSLHGEQGGVVMGQSVTSSVCSVGSTSTHEKEKRSSRNSAQHLYDPNRSITHESEQPPRKRNSGGLFFRLRGRF